MAAATIPPEMSYASDAIKQVLTLATGVLTLSVTFHNSFAPGLKSTQETFLFWSWGLLLAAVFLGVFCLLAITGAVMNALTIKDWLVRLPWIGQLVTFVVGVAFLVVFAFEVV